MFNSSALLQNLVVSTPPSAPTHAALCWTCYQVRPWGHSLCTFCPMLIAKCRLCWDNTSSYVRCVEIASIYHFYQMCCFFGQMVFPPFHIPARQWASDTISHRVGKFFSTSLPWELVLHVAFIYAHRDFTSTCVFHGMHHFCPNTNGFEDGPRGDCSQRV